MNCFCCNNDTKLSKCINCSGIICTECINSNSNVFHHLNIRYCPVCDKVFNMKIDLSTSFFHKNYRYDLIGIDYGNRIYKVSLKNGNNGYLYFNSSIIFEETPPSCLMHEKCNHYTCTHSCYNFDNNFKELEENKNIISQYARYRENYNTLVEEEYEKKEDARKNNIYHTINFENIEKMSFKL